MKGHFNGPMLMRIVVKLKNSVLGCRRIVFDQESALIDGVGELLRIVLGFALRTLVDRAIIYVEVFESVGFLASWTIKLSYFPDVHR